MSSDAPDRRQQAEGATTEGLLGSTVDFLSGDWDVERHIFDYRTCQIGSFLGTASFRSCADSAAGPSLAYVESGELRLGSHRGPAGRSLLVLDAGDGTADVRFADGREFYRLDLRGGCCTALHPCRADQYYVTATRLGAASYSETWRVTGPEKNYVFQTTYTRTAGAASESTPGSPR